MYREAREHFSFLLFSLSPFARPRILFSSLPLPGTEGHPQKHFRSPRLSIYLWPHPLESLSIPLLLGTARSRQDDGVDRPRRPILHLNLVNSPELANELRVPCLILARSCSAGRVYRRVRVRLRLHAVRVDCTTDTLRLMPLERSPRIICANVRNSPSVQSSA